MSVYKYYASKVIQVYFHLYKGFACSEASDGLFCPPSCVPVQHTCRHGCEGRSRWVSEVAYESKLLSSGTKVMITNPGCWTRLDATLAACCKDTCSSSFQC